MSAGFGSGSLLFGFQLLNAFLKFGHLSFQLAVFLFQLASGSRGVFLPFLFFLSGVGGRLIWFLVFFVHSWISFGLMWGR